MNRRRGHALPLFAVLAAGLLGQGGVACTPAGPGGPGGGGGTPGGNGSGGMVGIPGGMSGSGTGGVPGGSGGGVDAAAPGDARGRGGAGGTARDAGSIVTTDGPIPAALQTLDSPCLGTPDPDVAAGPTLVGTAIQWNAYFFKKDTGALDHMYRWKALTGRLISDTHIVYDATSMRWYMTTIVGLTGGSTGVQVMVSSGPDANDWALSVPITMPRLIDDPMPTVTADKVVITEHGACVWVLDKALLQAGNAPIVQATSCAVKQNNQIYAVKYGLQVPTTAYGITAVDGSTLNWIAVDGTPAGNDLKITEHQLKVAPYNEVPVFGGLLQSGADIESPGVKAMWDQNHLVWTKTLKCPGGAQCSVIRLYDVDTGAHTIQSTDFNLPGSYLFNAAPGLDRHRHTWILAATSTATGPVGLALFGRSAEGQIYAPSLIVRGMSALTGNRFGDYAAAAQDPVDGSLWMINQYAAASKAAGINTENTAGCKVVHLTAP